MIRLIFYSIECYTSNVFSLKHIILITSILDLKLWFNLIIRLLY